MSGLAWAPESQPAATNLNTEFRTRRHDFAAFGSVCWFMEEKYQ